MAISTSDPAASAIIVSKKKSLTWISERARMVYIFSYESVVESVPHGRLYKTMRFIRPELTRVSNKFARSRRTLRWKVHSRQPESCLASVLLAPPACNMEAINDTRPDLKGGKPEVSRLTHKPSN